MPDILPLLLTLAPVLSRKSCRHLHLIVEAMLAMTGRITQLGISRWTKEGASYRTVHRFFHTKIDWAAVQWHFFETFCYDPEGVYLLAGDESVITKSGKRTFGLDRFFSSLYDKAVPSISAFSIALIHVGKRQAYSLATEQVVRTEEEKQAAKSRKQARKKTTKRTEATRARGRPKGSKNKNKADVSLNPELTRILAQGQKVKERLKDKIKLVYFVLDGHFGNHPACQMVRQLDLHLISKMRYNAALWLEPTEAQKALHPRLKYGDKLDYANLPVRLLCSEETQEGYCTQVYQVSCWHKEFACRLNVVILKKTHVQSGRVGHVVLFSSDLSLSAECLLDYYRLRFQIEFTFRDAKQHFGLEDFMGVQETSVANGIGLSFFLVNLTTYLLEDFRRFAPGAGIVDLKSFYRGRFYLETLLKMLPDRPDVILCERLLVQASRLGCIHKRSEAAVELKRAA
jgi:putative transposase